MVENREFPSSANDEYFMILFSPLRIVLTRDRVQRMNIRETENREAFSTLIISNFTLRSFPLKASPYFTLLENIMAKG